MIYKSYRKTSRTLTIIGEHNKKPVIKTFPDSSSEYAEGVALIAKKNFKGLLKLLTRKSSEKVKVKVKGGKTTHTVRGRKLPAALVSYAKDVADIGLSLSPLENFLKRLSKNPSENSKKQLEYWITKKSVTLLPDGRFVLYKGVIENSDGKLVSNWDRKTPHDVGSSPRLDRSKCDDNPNEECGSGLHVATSGSVDGWYPNMPKLEIYVDPEHVVSVPRNGTKLRCCEYYVNRLMSKQDTVQEGYVAITADSSVTKDVVGGEKVTIPAILVASAGFKVGDSLAVCYSDNAAVISPESDAAVWKTSVLGEGTLRLRTSMIRKWLKVRTKKTNLKATATQGKIVLVKQSSK